MRHSDNTQTELNHLAAMISQLERVHPVSTSKPTSAVTRPLYWRKRVNAILGAGNLPPSMTAQVSALLVRLEKLDRR